MARRRQHASAFDGPPVEEDRHFVTALARGLEVLACFRRGEGLLGNQEIAARAGLPKSTVSRLTHTLTRLGYLHYVPDLGKYRLGTAILGMASAMLGKMDLRRVARPLLRDLAVQTRSVAALGTRDRLSMLYLELARGDSAISLNLDVGSRISLPNSAIGRAYLACCDRSEREDLMGRIRDLDELAWPKVKDGIERALADHERLGVCCSFGDWHQNVNAIAAGFRPKGGLPPMVVNLGAPSFLVSQDYLLNEVRPKLMDMVARLDSILAFGGAELEAARAAD
jgi:DNA-binding IclR family transcriptional regulator